MASAGASPEEIVKALQESMKATGASAEEIAKTVLTAMASSGADPEDIAKTMQELLQDSGKYLYFFFRIFHEKERFLTIFNFYFIQDYPQRKSKKEFYNLCWKLVPLQKLLPK